jgi:hypothetical protein
MRVDVTVGYLHDHLARDRHRCEQDEHEGEFRRATQAGRGTKIAELGMSMMRRGHGNSYPHKPRHPQRPGNRNGVDGCTLRSSIMRFSGLAGKVECNDGFVTVACR